MGRKYKQLKEALRTNPVRTLIVIDDLKIRRQMFKKSADLFKKIDAIETNKENFYKQDQALFNSWVELTFREEKAQHLKLIEEYESLASFQNHMIAVSEIEKLTMPEAYLVIKNENDLLKNGSPQDIARIEKIRLERDQYIRKATSGEDGFDEIADMIDEIFDMDDDDEDSFSKKDDPSLSKYEKEAYENIKTTGEDEMRSLLGGKDGFELFIEAMIILTRADDQEHILTLWNLAPHKLRQRISKDYRKNTGASFEEFLELLQENDFDEEGFEDENEEASNEYIHPGQSKIEHLSAAEQLELKSAYRKLARMIHPDSQDTSLKDSLKDWYAKIWTQVQNCYKAKDLTSLKRLEILSSLRLMDLRSLTMDEISSSAFWLEDELFEIKSSLKDLQKHPAWKFSEKSSYEALKKRLKKEMTRDMAPLISDIERLTQIQQHLAMLAKTQPPKRKNPRRKKAKTSRRPNRSRAGAEESFQQRSLFDDF